MFAAEVTAAPTHVLELGDRQAEVFSSTARFRVLIAGRRFGKTHLADVDLIARAVERPGSVNWYVGPTYRQAKQITWRLLLELLPSAYIASVNESDLTVELVNGSRIQLRGADNPDALRGVGLDQLVLDEFATMREELIWEEVLRPALSDRQGGALFITTPKGFNWAYDLYQRGQNRTQYPDWQSWRFDTLDGGRVTPEEIDQARVTSHPKLFEQEYLASFTTQMERVYDAFDRAVNVTAEVTDLPTLPLLVGQDFNINPMSSVLAVRVADQCHVFDELELPSSNTQEVADELARRYPGRRVVVCPDPSGNARRTNASSGTTDFTILRNAGFTVHAPKAAPSVIDRINNVQTLCRAADGTARLFVHPRCERLIRCLEGQTYKDDTRLPDKSAGLDHLPDALGYLCWSEFNVLTQGRWQQLHYRL